MTLITTVIAAQRANKASTLPGEDLEKVSLLERLAALEAAREMPGGINFQHVADQQDK